MWLKVNWNISWIWKNLEYISTEQNNEKFWKKSDYSGKIQDMTYIYKLKFLNKHITMIGWRKIKHTKFIFFKRQQITEINNLSNYNLY